MAEAIRGSAHSVPPSRLVRLRTGSDRPPLLLVHPIGGSVFCYADLVARLKSDGPIYGLQAAGLQRDEPLPESIEEMAQDYLHSAATIIGMGPVHLAGWSFGGLVAVEMARQLALMGRPAGSVTLIDTPARRAFGGNEDESQMLRMAAGALGIAPERATGVLALSQGQIEQTTRVIRNSRRLRQHYHRRVRIPVPLTLVRAGLEPGARDEDFDWTAIVDGNINTIVLAATHDSIVRAPHVEAVARILDGKMAGSDGTRP
jgi:thioesterase domain-containing protein